MSRKFKLSNDEKFLFLAHEGFSIINFEDQTGLTQMGDNNDLT